MPNNQEHTHSPAIARSSIASSRKTACSKTTRACIFFIKRPNLIPRARNSVNGLQHNNLRMIKMIHEMNKRNRRVLTFKSLSLSQPKFKKTWFSPKPKV